MSKKTDLEKGGPKVNTYLFTIGIDKYQYLPVLYNAVNDVRNLTHILTEKYQFEDQNSYSLINEEATRDNIIDHFARLREKTTIADNLVIYFSGHGYYNEEKEEGFWLPYDADLEEKQNQLSNREVVAQINRVNCKHTLLIVDSCFSGAYLFKDRELRAAYQPDYDTGKEEAPSRWVLASGRNEIIPDGRLGMNSPFAENLLRILLKNEKPLSFQKLCIQLQREFESSYEKNDLIAQPLKLSGDKGGQFVFNPVEEERKFWKKAIVKNTRRIYEQYLERYPSGIFAEEIKNKIEKLEEAKDWKKAAKKNSPQALEAYLEQHPNGVYQERAQKALRNLKTETALKKHDAVRIDFPETCLLENEEKLSIEISLIDENGAFTDRKNQNHRMHGHDAVWYIIISSSGFEIKNKHKKIERPKDNAPVSVDFYLMPIEAGSQIIEIELYQQSNRVGYYLVKTNVKEAAWHPHLEMKTL